MSEGATIMARLGLDIKGFKQELQNANSAAGQFAKNLGKNLAQGIGALGLGAVVKEVVEYGAHIEDLSRRFGVSTEALQKFGNAAELNGSSLEAVAKGFRFLAVNQAKALSGNDAMLQSFNALGISINDLKSLSPEQIMLKIGSSSLNAADTVKVLGKSALELRPILAGLADGTIHFGDAISDIDIKALKEAEDTFKQLKQTVTILVGSGLGAFFENVADSAAGLAGPIRALSIELKALYDVAVLLKPLSAGAFLSPSKQAEALGNSKQAGDILNQAKKDSEAAMGAGAKAAEEGRLERKFQPGKPRRNFAIAPEDTGAGESDDFGRSIGGGRGRGSSSNNDDSPLRDTWGAKWEAGGHPGRIADVGESQSLVDQIERNRLADELAKRPGAQVEVETGTGGPSLTGAAAAAARKADVDRVRENSRAAELERQTQIENTRRAGQQVANDRASEVGRGLVDRGNDRSTELKDAAKDLKDAASELKKSLTNQ